MSLLKANHQNIDNAKFGLRRNPDRQALGALGEITVPVLIVVGEYDIPDVHAHAGAIEAGIRGSRRIVIKDAGHIVPLEQPDAFDQAMMSFLKYKDFSTILSLEGATAAVEYFHRMRETEPDVVLFEEGRLNSLAYQTLFSGDVEGAIALFELNVEAYPDSWNVYDSLAEAYATAGQNALAIKNYRRSLELNPGNTNAVERLKALGLDR
jgi:tetratricopeptide (TPR) repeat protein